MDPKFEEIEEVLIEIFLDLYNKFPLSIILDMLLKALPDNNYEVCK